MTSLERRGIPWTKIATGKRWASQTAGAAEVVRGDRTHFNSFSLPVPRFDNSNCFGSWKERRTIESWQHCGMDTVEVMREKRHHDVLLKCSSASHCNASKIVSLRRPLRYVSFAKFSDFVLLVRINPCYTDMNRLKGLLRRTWLNVMDHFVTSRSFPSIVDAK